MPFADILRAHRAKKGLTQAELAEKMKISRHTIINWEKGVTDPDVHEVETLSKVLEVDVEELQLAIDLANTSKGGKSPEEIYRDLVENNTQYRLVPKTILDEEYRIVLKSEIDLKEQMLKEVIESKNDLIRELKEEIKDLRSRQAIVPSQQA